MQRGWSWEYEDEFDRKILQYRNSNRSTVNWVDFDGNPVVVSGGVANLSLAGKVEKIKIGSALGSPRELIYRDTSQFHAGELHAHIEDWVETCGRKSNASTDESSGLDQGPGFCGTIFPTFLRNI